MKNKLLELAKESIKKELDLESNFNIEKLIETYPELKKNGACFVTLTINNQLRGCVGSLSSYRPLYEDIILNAKAAAMSDDRFPDLTSQELKITKIEISILSEPEILDYINYDDLKNKLKPLKDGVILNYNESSATYLPQVWEQLKTPEEFLRSLSEKAGVEIDFNKDKPEIKTYSVDSFEEGNIRLAGNKGVFYPEYCTDLKEEIKKYKSSNQVIGISPRAIVVPHAGYIYSGETAYMAYESLSRTKPKRVIVVGPSHHYGFKGITGSFFDEYETPCGNLKIDLDYLKMISKKFNIQDLRDIHSIEHSTETQIPFIKNIINDTSVIELIYGEIEVYELEELFKFLLEDEDNVLVISTDLSHFHSLDEANIIDKHCIDGFIEETTFQNCEACGILGLRAIRNLSRKEDLKTMILDYRTSFKETQDKGSVVGYMSGIVYKNRFDF